MAVKHYSKVRAYFLLPLIMAMGHLSCSTIKTGQTPLWAGNIEAAFPNNDFIAQKGYGVDRKTAETDALSAISRYFSMSISTSARETVSITDQGSTSTIDSDTFVSSQTTLFAVHYTDPWFNQPVKQWETVAYINRAEAWGVFEPRLRQKADAFRALVDEAENQGEPFLRILFYIDAANLASREDMLQQFYFADALNPLGASFFDDTRAMLSELPAKIEKSKTGAAIYVECENDYDGSVYTAVASVFSNAELPVEKEKGNAAYSCMIAIGENVQKLDAGTFYYPTIAVTLNGKNGAIASYNKTLARVGASDPDVAKRRAYTAIANEIRQSFFENLGKDTK